MSNPITCKVEIEFVPKSGAFIDVSGRVFGLQIIRPRTAPADSAAASTLILGLLNSPATAAEVSAWGTTSGTGMCPFSPDSPLAAFWPYVTRERRVRVTYGWNAGANSSVRFFGWLDIWNPDAGPSPPSTATVTVSGSCVLSRYARRKILSPFGEALLTASNTAYWPLDDAEDSTVVRCASVNSDTADGQVVFPNVNNAGSLTLSETDGGVIADGVASFTRGDPNGPSPVLLMALNGNQLGRTHVAVKLDDDIAGANDDICCGYDASGALLWRFSARVSGGLVFFTIFDSNGTIQSDYGINTGRDDAWRYFELQWASATLSGFAFRKKNDANVSTVGGFGTFASDPRNTRYITFGGNMSPFKIGKTSNTLKGSVSCLAVQYNTASVVGYSRHALPLVPFTADEMYLRTVTIGNNIDTLVGGASGALAVDPTPTFNTMDNAYLLDRWNQLAVTTGGRITTLPNGQRQYRTAAEIRSSTPAITLDAEQDLSAPAGGWGGVKEERPTRITVEGPIGSTTLIDAASETSVGMQLNGSVPPTMAGAVTVLQSVAGRVLTAGSNRLNSFGADWTSTSTSKLTAAMALVPGDRMRIAGLSSALVGYTQVDVYASGWSEVYDPADQSCSWVFDSDPADDPAEAVWDDAEYGRWALPPGGLTPAVLLSDTFTGSTGAAWSASWTTASTSTGSSNTIQSNAGQIVTGSAGGYVGSHAVRTTSITAADASMLFSFQWITGDECYPRAWLRNPDTAMSENNGYWVELNRPANFWQMGVTVAGVNTVMGQLGPTVLFGTSKWWCRWGIVGTMLKARVWADGLPEPGTWDLTGSDTQIAAAGYAGWTLRPGNIGLAKWTVDDLAISADFPGGATITGGTTVGNTGTGTGIVTSSDPLTATGGDYPLDLDWNGERETISGVGGATSPQTATVTARGVTPTVARVHAAGENVQVYHAFTWGP